MLDVPDSGDPTAALADAQKALEQQLGVSLAKTYESTVMIQYNSVVDFRLADKPGIIASIVIWRGEYRRRR